LTDFQQILDIIYSYRIFQAVPNRLFQAIELEQGRIVQLVQDLGLVHRVFSPPLAWALFRSTRYEKLFFGGQVAGPIV
jgi:hypothetical protein